MASLMEMLNQGLAGFNTPAGQLGIQMLMNSGYQQGNPGFGERMGNALGGMQKMQMAQEAMGYQKVLREQQAQEIELRKQTMAQQVQQRQALKKMAEQDPTFLANNPTARALILAGGDTAAAADLSKLSPVPKPPTMPGVFEKHNPDGTVTQQIYDPQVGTHVPGATYTPTEQQRATAYVDKTTQDMQYKPQEVQTQQQQAETAKQRAETMRLDMVRKQNAAAMKNRVSVAELNKGYRGATTQLDETIKLVDELLAPNSGLDGNFGIKGWIPNAPGSDAADARAKLTRLTAATSLSELTRLKERGVVLTPVSNVDLTTTGQSALAFDKAQSAEAYRRELQRYRETLVRSKEEAATNYNELVGAYQPPQQQQAPSNAPAIGTVMDGYRYNGGDPSDPNSWSKQ